LASSPQISGRLLDASSSDEIAGSRRREKDLILLCGAVQQSEERRAGIRRLLGGELDWQYVFRLAAQNNVAPLIASRLLNGDCRAMLPEAVARKATLITEAIALRNRHLSQRLIEIVAGLRRESIPCVAIKGAVLAVAAYRALHLRAFADLDLLVPRNDVARAVETLTRLGIGSRNWNLDAFASDFFPDTSIDLAARDVVLDLHWRLAPDYFPFAPDNEQAFRNAVEIDFCGARLMTLGAIDSVLFLASHAAKHAWGRLLYVCDFAHLLAAAKPANCEAMLQRADAIGCRTMLLTGVALAASMLGADIPAVLRERAARERRATEISRDVRRRIFEIHDETMFSEWAIAMRSIDTRRERARYLTKRLFRPRLSDAALLKLPRALYPIYYVARPALLAIKHGRSLFDSNA
jgi:hypothetical protein